MAAFVYNEGALRLLNGTDDYLTDTIKMGLSTTVHVPNKDDALLDEGGADDFVDGELTGTGYAGGFAGAGRKTLASKTVAKDAATDRVRLSSAAITWTAINAGTIKQGTLLKEITSDAASKPLANCELASTQATNGGDITFTPATDGWFYSQQ